MQSVFTTTSDLCPNKNIDLTNYYNFKKYFKDDEIAKILEIAEHYPLQQGSLTTAVDKSYRSSKIRWLPNNDETKWLYDKLAVLAKKANSRIWNFDIVGFGENIQISSYKAEEKGQYDWHIDIGKKIPHRKISISVQLSDPDDYEGGNLELSTGRNIKYGPREKGTVILFPSYFFHRVTEVTKGVRKSMVVWISGPSWK